jgi:hypothetical protein
MPRDVVTKLLLEPCANVAEALATALRDLPPNARVGILPYANATIPLLVTDQR